MFNILLKSRIIKRLGDLIFFYIMKINIDDKEFIVYGKSEFMPSKFEEVKNREWIKPIGGLWSSPVDSKYGWKDFVLSGEIDRSLDTYFIFKLKPNSKVYIIDSEEDLFNIPFTIKSIIGICIDFEKMKDNGYDGILLTWNGQKKTRFTSNPYFDLYGWDVESLLVLNKDCIDVIEN